MVKKTIVLITNIPFLLGENTARAQHEPFVHVVVHSGNLPGLGLDGFTEVAGVGDTREAARENQHPSSRPSEELDLPEYVVIFPPLEISHVEMIILQ